MGNALDLAFQENTRDKYFLVTIVCLHVLINKIVVTIFNLGCVCRFGDCLLTATTEMAETAEEDGNISCNSH